MSFLTVITLLLCAQNVKEMRNEQDEIFPLMHTPCFEGKSPKQVTATQSKVKSIQQKREKNKWHLSCSV